jgi:PPOX class probable F420-dependent enzyme
VQQSGAFAPFTDQRTVLVTTYKRDGTAVAKPMSIAVEGDRAFLRSAHKAWKVKRLRNNPNVLVAPCTFRGKPVEGPTVRATARLLEGEEDAHASDAIKRKYRVFEGMVVPALFWLSRWKALHYELTATSAGDAATAPTG